MLDLHDYITSMFSSYANVPVLNRADMDPSEGLIAWGLAGKVRDTEYSHGERWLRRQGEYAFKDNGDQLFRAQDSFKQKEADRVASYFTTEAGELARAKACEAARIARLPAVEQRRAERLAAREAVAEVKAEARRKLQLEVHARYEKTDKGREASRAAKRRWWETTGQFQREAKRAVNGQQ